MNYLALTQQPTDIWNNVSVQVDLFKDIPPGLLHELVLKMKSVLFTPGDIVCQRGDIGREMFIVKDGKLAVTTDVGTLIVMLREGDYFGEISLLAVNDSNRYPTINLWWNALAEAMEFNNNM